MHFSYTVGFLLVGFKLHIQTTKSLVASKHQLGSNKHQRYDQQWGFIFLDATHTHGVGESLDFTRSIMISIYNFICLTNYIEKLCPTTHLS